MAIPGLRPIHEGWARHQAMLTDTLRDLTPNQLAFKTAPHQWAIWQLAAHIGISRAGWFHDALGEGDQATRDMFRVERTTVPGLSLEHAGWEDVEDEPRTAAELVEALDRTWAIVDDCLQRWTVEDLDTPVVGRDRTHDRGWVMWHVLEHDIHHGGETSQILGSNGLQGLDP